MTTEQIEQYLEKYNLTSEKDLKTHIKQLKTNTVVPHEIIFSLEEVLHNQDPVFSIFSREKENKNIGITFSEKETSTQPPSGWFIYDIPLGTRDISKFALIELAEKESINQNNWSLNMTFHPMDFGFTEEDDTTLKFKIKELEDLITAEKDKKVEERKALANRYKEEALNNEFNSAIQKLLEECDEHQSKFGRIDLDKIIYGIDTEKGYFSAPWTFDDKVKEFKFTDVMNSSGGRAVGLPKDYLNFGEKEIKTEKNIYNNIKKEVEYPKSPLEAFKGVKETEGEKYNSTKLPISLLFIQFPKALKAVVECSQYGHNKYKATDQDYLNFKRVKEGSKAYADAGLRHRLEQGADNESGLPHVYHVVWNALAELELYIEENSAEKK